MAFDRVRGHEPIVAQFARAVERGRLGHAYLFAGPPGVGKRLFAVELARALLCESPPAGRFDSCDNCPACQLINAGTHPDLFLVARPADKLEFPIEVIRELSQSLALKPARGGRKIAVVDDADDFNEEAANCFLKTLEEPPPKSLLILIGTGPDRLLPTVRSRCQVIPFQPLPLPIVSALLRADGIADAAQVERLTRLSDGSPGLARDLADPALWEFRRSLFRELIQPKPNGPALARTAMELIEGAGKDAALQRRRAALLVRLIVDGFRHALRISLGNGPPTADADEGRTLSQLVERLGTEKLIDHLDRCLDADMHIDRRVQLVLLVEAFVDSLTLNP